LGEKDLVDDMGLELHWNPGDLTVRWARGGHTIVKEFADPPRSAIYVREPASVVIVESMESAGALNAVVYELDGRERLRLQPLPVDSPIGFDQVFESRAGLVAVFATRRGDIQGVPDLTDGELRELREWR